MSVVDDFLATWNLRNDYAELFKSKGITSLAALRRYSAKDLQDMGVKQFHARKLQSELAKIEPVGEVSTSARQTPVVMAPPAPVIHNSSSHTSDPSTLLSLAPQHLTHALALLDPPPCMPAKPVKTKSQMQLDAPVAVFGASELCINCGAPNRCDFVTCDSCQEPRLLLDGLAQCSLCMAPNFKQYVMSRACCCVVFSYVSCAAIRFVYCCMCGQVRSTIAAGLDLAQVQLEAAARRSQVEAQWFADEAARMQQESMQRRAHSVSLQMRLHEVVRANAETSARQQQSIAALKAAAAAAIDEQVRVDRVGVS